LARGHNLHIRRYLQCLVSHIEVHEVFMQILERRRKQAADLMKNNSCCGRHEHVLKLARKPLQQNTKKKIRLGRNGERQKKRSTDLRHTLKKTPSSSCTFSVFFCLCLSLNLSTPLLLSYFLSISLYIYLSLLSFKLLSQCLFLCPTTEQAKKSFVPGHSRRQQH
jgi:hypothetical protein